MSLDKLAIIFIIIILPISIVLNLYTDAQTKTLDLQNAYDVKLNNATADAIKAYQLNAFNESTSNLASVKMRDINAASNAFFTALEANFDMQGYSKNDLQEYVPALVFTMYDGYYMYSKYINTLTDEDYVTQEEADANNTMPSTYQNDPDGSNPLYGVKPFVSYSTRYKDFPEKDDDFVISYTLDNYITIQGNITIRGTPQWINDSGYLIDINKTELNDDKIKYRGIEIAKESCLEENIGNEKYKYHKINGVKYYYDDRHKDSSGNNDPKWFTLLNGQKVYDTTRKFDCDFDFSAYNYYKEAYNFTHRIIDKYNLENLTPEKSTDINELNQSVKNGKIFNVDDIEAPTSYFNEHRLAVIRHTIEKNLSIAIKNYNHYSTVEADFQMPELKETEWDKILNNMTLISFLQGMPIGGKFYNGCSVIANNKNDEVVNEGSIYIANKPFGSNYYKATYNDFDNISTDDLIGVFNVDLERKEIEDTNSFDTFYYYPKLYYADYDSIVFSKKNVNLYSTKTDNNYNYDYNGNIFRYLEEKAGNNETYKKVASAYFTALGREKFSSYKPTRTYLDSPQSNSVKTYSVPINAVKFSNNHRYYLYYDDCSSWEEAEAFCQSVGGHLVTITSPIELTELGIYLKNRNFSDYIWIGLNNKKWITNEGGNVRISASNGNPFSFNNTSISSNKLYFNIGYFYNADTSKSTYFVCEWE